MTFHIFHLPSNIFHCGLPRYGIRTPDAIQFAIGIENNGTLFITNDKNLKKVKEIEVLVLEEYL
ncbi:MAG: hypothetical protein KJ666_00350 [Bacteroidetes bacterium]|nr:hypothetical protein [Bacteroidota bacterium]MBU2584156.1 hypothetical protein [Bacteroidota bacterium]